MSSLNVIEALKKRRKYYTKPVPYPQKDSLTFEVINEQKQNNHQQTPSGPAANKTGYLSRDTRGPSSSQSANTADYYSRNERNSERNSDYRSDRDNDYRNTGRNNDYRSNDRNNDRGNEYQSRDRRGYDRGNLDRTDYPSGRDTRGHRGPRGDENYRGNYRNDRYDSRDDRFDRRDNWRDRDRVDDKKYRERERDVGYRSRSEDLTNVTPINEVKRNSLWDIKPKGFEKISSERAKISGLFPLPGEAKRIDISKLEGLVSSGYLNSQTSILFEQKSINSLVSRSSKQLIITGVEFTLFPVERLVDYLRNFIDSLNLNEAFIVNYELLESKYLVLHLSNHIVTTILFASFKYFQNDLNLKIKLERPHGYVTPIATNEESIQTETINDDERKLAITNIPFDIQEYELSEDLEDIGKVENLLLLKDKEDNSKGIAFVKFSDIQPEDAIDKINKVIINESTLVSFYASKGLYSQSKTISYRSIADIAESRESNIETNILVLLNAILPEDLKNPSVYEEFEKDLLEECSKYGKVESIKIPKPDNSYKRNLKHLHTNVGKVFVRFAEKESAIQASRAINGRKYNERTVLVSFIPELDYKLNLL